MDFSKIKNSKFLKVALAIALPTVIVAGYYGYKFIRRKFQLKDIEKEALASNDNNIKEEMLQKKTDTEVKKQDAVQVKSEADIDKKETIKEVKK